MFNSTILDIAIGIVFVYLLVSLIITAATELLSGWLKWRPNNLWLGIQNLVDDAGQSDWVKKIYDHPLIQGMSPIKPIHNAQASGFGKFLRALFGWLSPEAKGPSYIPSRTFVVALLDSIRDSDPLGLTKLKSGLLAIAAAVPEALPAGKTNADLAKDVADRLTALVPADDVKGSTADAVRRDLKALIATVDSGGYGPADLQRLVQKAASTVPDRYVRDLIVEKIPNTSLGRALVALFDESEQSLEKLKDNIEVWFNSSMDRVSGWYKRKTQLVHIVLAVFLTVGLNVDSLLIVRALSTDAALRDSIVAQAKGYAEQHQPAASAPATQPAATPTPATPAAGDPAAAAAPSSATAPASSAPAAGAPGPTAALSAPTAGSGGAPPSSASFQEIQAEIDGLNLPVGWLDPQAEKQAGRTDTGYRIWPGWLPAQGETTSAWFALWVAVVRFHFFGWLLTAVAASLGAPFWFDLLNRFITIRASGKAPEEKPKSPKEVPPPLAPGEEAMQAEVLKALAGSR